MRKGRRRSPQPSGGNPAGGHGGLSLIDSLGRLAYPAQPAPIFATMYSGRQVSTDIGEDRNLQNRPSVIVLTTAGSVWVANASLNYFALNPTGADTDINNLLGTFSQELYGRIARRLMANQRLLVRDTTLDNTGTPADSLGIFMDNYVNAFMGLRGLAGWLAIGNINETTSAIANAIDANLPKLKADLDRLDSIPMSPTFMRMLDRLCGPKWTDQEQLVIGQQYGFGPTALDMTSATNIATILTNIEVALNNLLSAPPTNMRNDFQRIMNTFALAYGPTSPVYPKPVGPDDVEFALIANTAITWHDTTLVKVFTHPSTVIFGDGSIPVLVPRKADHTSEAVKQLFSLWRSGVFTKDAPAGVAAATGAQVFGLLAASSNAVEGTRYVAYPQAGNPATTAEFAGATGAAVTAENIVNDTFVWATEASHEIATASAEVRGFGAWDVYYVSRIWLTEETEYQGTVAFLGDIKDRAGGVSRS